MFKVKESFETSKTLMRDACCQGLLDAAEKNPDVVVLDADLVNSSGLKPFFKFYPDRAFDCGVAEADMIGIAAGLSAAGKIPFTHTFGCFASRRVCDQIMISCAYAKLNVKMIGSDPGVTAAKNGGTHMPFEDMAVLRAIPDITLIEPTDPVMMRALIGQLPERERQVIALRYYHGQTQQSCARILHVSQVQISRLEKRAVERLRERLQS